MRVYFKFFVFIFAVSFAACAADEKPSTPLETLKAYTQAIKRKDTTEMKLLLSDASIKMAQQEAKAQGRSLDDIVKDETLFTEAQTSLRFRNQKIDGNRASIEVENSFGGFDTVPFVREDGAWKIDKQAIADQMLKQNEEGDKKLDDLINQGKQP